MVNKLKYPNFSELIGAIDSQESKIPFSSN